MRIAVPSPFVDRRHGTERALSEALLRLARDGGWEIHLYAQRVEELDVVEARSGVTNEAGRIYWHPVRPSGGPHLLQFARWYLRNRALRENDQDRGLTFDAVFSPGINSSDANVILVHAVFHRLAELEAKAPRSGLRGLHQRLYYKWLCSLERRIYADRRVTLAAVSARTARQLSRYFGRDDVTVISNGVDSDYFSPGEIAPLRWPTRQRFGFREDETLLLLVGNDWQNKGLATLLNAATLLETLPVKILAVGQEDPLPFLNRARELGVESRVRFTPPVSDVRHLYAAADILVAPSLEDSFNLPALEAMSCGLPVIVSGETGVSERARHGENALVLQDPRDARALADLIRELCTNPDLYRSIAVQGRLLAQTLTWDRHARELRALLERARYNRS